VKSFSKIVCALTLAALLPAGFAQVLVVRPNVNINRQSGYQAEEAIAIDPTNPKRMFAWSNDLGNRNSAAYTTNGGVSWTSRFTGSDGWPSLGGDPTCSFDKFGNLYGASFSSSFGSILVRASTNGGQTFPTSLLTITTTLDQPTIKAGPGTNANNAAVWIFHYGDTDMVARGAAVTAPGAFGAFGTAHSIPGSASGNFGDIAIGPTGQVAVAYQTPSGSVGPSTIQFALNSSGSTAGSFALSAATVNTMVGGFRLIPAQPNRSVDAELGLAYDISTGLHRGRLYLVYTDASSTTTDDLDIFLRYSDDNAGTWSAPLRVNDDTTSNSQFFSKIALDPVTGNVGLAWYDCRNSLDNTRVELWATVSVDGGLSVLPNVKVSAGSTSGVGKGSGNELGDYIGLDFYNNVLYPCWADDSNSTGDNPDGTSDLDYYGAAVTFIPPPVPPLAVFHSQFTGSAEVLTLAWTNTGANFTLESAGALPGTWTTVSSPRATNANLILTTVTNATAAQFYRLRR
jgi:hypothetical protein